MHSGLYNIIKFILIMYVCMINIISVCLFRLFIFLFVYTLYLYDDSITYTNKLDRSYKRWTTTKVNTSFFSVRRNYNQAEQDAFYALGITRQVLQAIRYQLTDRESRNLVKKCKNYFSTVIFNQCYPCLYKIRPVLFTT